MVQGVLLDVALANAFLLKSLHRIVPERVALVWVAVQSAFLLRQVRSVLATSPHTHCASTRAEPCLSRAHCRRGFVRDQRLQSLSLLRVGYVVDSAHLAHHAVQIGARVFARDPARVGAQTNRRRLRGVRWACGRVGVLV